MILSPVPAVTVAERLLYLAARESRVLTPMQILKLVYISHGWMLGLLDQPLILETVEAWRYGPVVRSLYRRYRRYRGGPIPEGGNAHDEALDDQQANLVDQVFRGYGSYTGIELSRLTHQPDTPWDTAWNSGMSVIPNELIRDHYRRRAEELAAAAAG